ncbi:hypothetical protein GZ77_01660 [Endozoicomonas montiporae]|uniref:Calpain catalytic domain-containing protein n=2 Tax=Endozoicomonas montiporae TaxID=1027273 RepID=A0A081NAA8_9GAMM|nr:hypothetical protein [Endozoicomonas montiporae]AMO56937.1 hypothetical protein EZMO1_2893 [Endozoicomonas montiporae CL-33]KEQ15381.1 hypothetical protein GZ77_01660 [Endozoicomonas montiporae]
MSDPLSPDNRTSHSQGLPDSFVVSDSQDTGSAANPELHNRFKARFGLHSVEKHEPEMRLSLKPYQGKISRFQQAIGKRLLRTFGKAKALMTPSRIADPQPVPEWKQARFPASEWKEQLYDNQVDMFVPDQSLLGNMADATEGFAHQEKAVLFNDGVPEPSDIAQLDRRHTCFLLGALAGYAASPLGKPLLQQIIRLYPGGFVGVSLNDPSLAERIVKVLVSSDRPVDQNGKDYYSFGNASGARWAGYIEKACHAFLLEQSANVARMKSELSEGGDHLEGLLRLLTSNKKSGCLIDRIDMSLAFNLLPPMPELKSPGSAFKQSDSQELFDVRGDDLKSELNKDLIICNIKQGIPVILGTRGDWQGKLNATSGTPTDHAVAVLGPASIVREGKKVEGFLTYDPYGEAFGSTDMPSTSGDATAVKSAGQAVRFCSYDDIYDNFARLTIARGGFVHDKAYLNQLAGGKPATSRPDDGWELV